MSNLSFEHQALGLLVLGCVVLIGISWAIARTFKDSENEMMSDFENLKERNDKY